jgi:uncharacterized membrane protein YdjX (TVP38/TMEM64 family)
MRQTNVTYINTGGLRLKNRNKQNGNQDKTKKLLGIYALTIFILFTLAVTWFAGKPLIKFVSQPEEFRAWVDSSGIWSRTAFIGMVVLQVIIAIIPGEPLEIGAGYAFGIWEGTLLCLAGVLIGSIIVFLLVRRFGVKLVEVFFSREKIMSLRFLKDRKRVNILAFFIMLIPGTPKDLLSYFAGLTDMKLSTWVLIVTVARIPSIVTSTIGGGALGMQNYQFAIIVFAVTVLISACGLLIYNRITKSHKGEQ